MVLVLPTSLAPACSSAVTTGAVAIAWGWVFGPVWVAVGGHAARDVEQVFHGEAEAGEPPAAERRALHARAGNKGSYSVVQRGHLFCLSLRLWHKALSGPRWDIDTPTQGFVGKL